MYSIVFLVTELARGCDLQRRFDNMDRPFSEERLIPMVRTIFEAFKTMHAHGIVHRGKSHVLSRHRQHKSKAATLASRSNKGFLLFFFYFTSIWIVANIFIQI